MLRLYKWLLTQLLIAITLRRCAAACISELSAAYSTGHDKRRKDMGGQDAGRDEKGQQETAIPCRHGLKLTTKKLVHHVFLGVTAATERRAGRDGVRSRNAPEDTVTGGDVTGSRGGEETPGCQDSASGGRVCGTTLSRQPRRVSESRGAGRERRGKRSVAVTWCEGRRRGGAVGSPNIRVHPSSWTALTHPYLAPGVLIVLCNVRKQRRSLGRSFTPSPQPYPFNPSLTLSPHPHLFTSASPLYSHPHPLTPLSSLHPSLTPLPQPHSPYHSLTPSPYSKSLLSPHQLITPVNSPHSITRCCCCCCCCDGAGRVGVWNDGEERNSNGSSTSTASNNNSSSTGNLL
ncbi:hypothetical protein O3P69_007416 [Scylla paramamosain]|uniref:Uncharacterized protein n=1 Tax=Scylla paramamosain TaxID=85552 RepID=A0AAW0V3D9_SCYPA